MIAVITGLAIVKIYQGLLRMVYPCSRQPPIKVYWVLMGTLLAISVSTAASSDDYYGLPAAEPESLGMSSEKLGAIKANLQPLIDENKVPGFVTVVARNGKVVHSEAFGSMDVERRKAMRPDTIFRMASMTKPITGAAVMILVQEGKISVSDPLSKYIPEFTEMKVHVQRGSRASSTVPVDKPITIEHLLTHTSGLTYGFFPNAVANLYAAAGLGMSAEQLAALTGSGGAVGDTVAGDGLTLEEFVKKAAEQPLLVQPGTQWNYSIAMNVLGRVVEVVSGQRYGDFLQERIFAPLGMKDAGFHVPKEKVARFAANYATQAAGMVLIDDPAESSYLKVPSLDSGGGGMVGTAVDYLRFAQMLLNGGELDGVRILSEESVQEMTSDHLGPEFGEAPLSTMWQAFGVPTAEAILGAQGIGFGYCGSVVRDGAGSTVFGTPGQYSWGGAWSTDFWIDRQQKLVGLVLTQITPGTAPIRMIMNDATYEALVERYEITYDDAGIPTGLDEEVDRPPHLRVANLQKDKIEFVVADKTGSQVTVQASEDLETWLTFIEAVIPGDGLLRVVDDIQGEFPQRFYRVRSLPAKP